LESFFAFVSFESFSVANDAPCASADKSLADWARIASHNVRFPYRTHGQHIALYGNPRSGKSKITVGRIDVQDRCNAIPALRECIHGTS
jgi:hypothetical protein